jgi:predicted O-methyltransferase YrrM
VRARLAISAVRWAAALARRAAQAVRELPLRIAAFYVAALALAVLRRDRWTLVSATRPRDLRILLSLSAGANVVAEIGTGPGWSSLALALAAPGRRVISFDVEDRGADRYARLVPRSVRERVEFVRAAGSDAAAQAGQVDFVFVDSSHQRDETIATFTAWRSKLSPGGVVVFHDYGHPSYPGVAEAVADLELDGHAEGDVYVWRSPSGS